MKLLTPVALPPGLPSLTHQQQLMLMGSCFATEIGERLKRSGFKCEVNPYGVLYNPLSIAQALREVLAGKHYATSDLYEHGGLWHSPMHHGDFSAPTVDEALDLINHRLEGARRALDRLDVLLLTWGTAYVYEETTTGRVVGNCHKLPEGQFKRRRLMVDEVVDDQEALFGDLLRLRPDLQIIITVSPVRHVRDGLHENQLSKATLLLAIDRLQTLHPATVHYFPAYEILTDELRDYRFYATDMVHPSALAVDYVWERLAETSFSPETRQVASEYEALQRMLAHRPLHPDGEEYRRFLGQILLKADQLSRKCPYLDLSFEKGLCHTRLSELPK